MHVINARNVNDAYQNGLDFLSLYGRVEDSRAGSVIVAPQPVVTSYRNPVERVLFDEKRDANPFFHLFESLWMLAGWRDARWLDKFVSDFSSRFAEDNGSQHGAYGYRWRSHFMLDQLDRTVQLLQKDPRDRRVVIQMWDAFIDYTPLTSESKRDYPCNLLITPRINRGALDITVMCRSNDAIWGAYGANAVHFSFLQEYLAARIGCEIGVYYQISNNFHVYEEVMEEKYCKENAYIFDYNRYSLAHPRYVQPHHLMDNPKAFDNELKEFMWSATYNAMPSYNLEYYTNSFFTKIAIPMFRAHHYFKIHKAFEHASMELLNMPLNNDWRMAATEWLERRTKKEGANNDASTS